MSSAVFPGYPFFAVFSFLLAFPSISNQCPVLLCETYFLERRLVFFLPIYLYIRSSIYVLFCLKKRKEIKFRKICSRTVTYVHVRFLFQISSRITEWSFWPWTVTFFSADRGFICTVLLTACYLMKGLIPHCSAPRPVIYPCAMWVWSRQNVSLS